MSECERKETNNWEKIIRERELVCVCVLGMFDVENSSYGSCIDMNLICLCSSKVKGKYVQCERISWSVILLLLSCAIVTAVVTLTVTKQRSK